MEEKHYQEMNNLKMLFPQLIKVRFLLDKKKMIDLNIRKMLYHIWR